jgi:hypothetical protein
MGRLRADPGEKHEPRVAISSSASTQDLYFVACHSVTTGAFAAPENDVRLLTEAAIEKLPFVHIWFRPCTAVAALLTSRGSRDRCVEFTAHHRLRVL